MPAARNAFALKALALRRGSEVISLYGSALAAREATLKADTVARSLAATLARLDASEMRYRLLLDAHQLWDFD